MAEQLQPDQFLTGIRARIKSGVELLAGLKSAKKEGYTLEGMVQPDGSCNGVWPLLALLTHSLMKDAELLGLDWSMLVKIENQFTEEALDEIALMIRRIEIKSSMVQHPPETPPTRHGISLAEALKLKSLPETTLRRLIKPTETNSPEIRTRSENGTIIIDAADLLTAMLKDRPRGRRSGYA